MKKTGKFFTLILNHTFFRLSGSQNTIVSYTLSEHDATMFLGKHPSGSQLDFRVEAFTGYWRDPMPQESALGTREQILVRGESSGWSSIQTITINYESPLSPPTQTAISPENPMTSNGNQTSSANFTLPTNFLLAIITFLLCVVVVLVILFLRRQLTQHQEKGLHV